MKDADGRAWHTLFWENKKTAEPAACFYMEHDAEPAANDPHYVAAKDRAYAEYRMHAEESLGEGLLWSLRIGVAIASIISIALSLVCCVVLFGALDWFLPFRIWFCIIIGLVAGITIGTWTECVATRRSSSSPPYPELDGDGVSLSHHLTATHRSPCIRSVGTAQRSTRP